MSAVRSFPPIASPDARVLVLGTMPGLASLAAQQYYAHPRNLFWPIMGALVGAAPELPYPERVARLQDAGIAVWDVFACCVRPGSLDAAIDMKTAEPHDFVGFFDAHPRINRVCFNGGVAAQAFRRTVLPRLPGRSLSLRQLPSTSPAHAARSFEEKLAAWRAVTAAA